MFSSRPNASSSTIVPNASSSIAPNTISGSSIVDSRKASTVTALSLVTEQLNDEEESELMICRGDDNQSDSRSSSLGGDIGFGIGQKQASIAG